MAGGLLNIIANGNNNVILTGNPSKTFFKVTYSKYTNFGLQKFRLDFDGSRSLRLSEPTTFTFKVKRYADLLMDTYLVVNIPDIWSPFMNPVEETNWRWSPYEFRWIPDLGTQMVEEILITCGSLTLQRYSGQYLKAMVERDFSIEKKELFNRMTGNLQELNDPANAFSRLNIYPNAYYTPNLAGAEPSIRGRTLYIPINTWFTMDSRCAFPLVALQYNELVIHVTLRPIQELFIVRNVYDYANNYPYQQADFNLQQFKMYQFLQTPPSENIIIPANAYENKNTTWNADVHLISTYCFLSNEESALFAAEDQVYLVKDVFEYKFYNITGTSRLPLTSNGMISSWMWFLQRNDVNMRNEWGNYTNWPYSTIPGQIGISPFNQGEPPPNDIPPSVTVGVTNIGYGPQYNPDGTNTGYYYTGDFANYNTKEILVSMGIILNGEYRENILESGVYNYVEKYTRTQGSAVDYLYCYNFCLNTNPFEYQPSGAINLSKFRTIELEVTTIVPPIDPGNSLFNIICDTNGNAIGVTKSNWQLNYYNYNMTLFEERYNVLTFVGGNCGMLYSR
jgi:hypothetical protein